jgi:hypothetical protein
MSDAADSMSVARRFAALASANRTAPTNHGRVAASFATLARQHAADRGLVHSRTLRAGYDLRVISDYAVRNGI